MSRAAKEGIERAKATGELPHEFLLRVSRGEPIDGKKPKPSERIDAAKAAAPYFAPKLTYTEGEAGKPGEFAQLQKMSEEQLSQRAKEKSARAQARAVRLGLGKVLGFTRDKASKRAVK